jgi:primosomal protein N'
MVAGTARWQVLFRAPELGALHQALGALLASWQPPSAVRVEPDVDPVNLM